MNFDDGLSPAQRDLRQRGRDSFKTIRERRIPQAAAQDSGSRLDVIWSALAELGYHGLLAPERYGGNSAGLLAAALVMEELAAHDLQSFAPVLLSMASTAIARFGSEELKNEILPRLARGEAHFVIASIEREAGFNVLNAKTAAKRQGDHFRVDGSKTYVSGMDVADYVLLVTRTTSREECVRRGLSSTAGLTLLPADAAARQQAARLMVHRAAALFDREAPVAEQAASANAAKYIASELAVLSADAAIDAFGGKGFDE